MDEVSPMRELSLLKAPVGIEGAVSLDTSQGGVMPWRIALRDRDLFEAGLCDKAMRPAGVRLTLVSDTRNIHLVAEYVKPIDAGNVDPTWSFDLLVDGKLHQRVTLPVANGDVRFTGIPAGEHQLEIYLPQFAPVRLKALRIDKHAAASQLDDARPKWLAYGSSITHCRAAAGPSETWPALVANRHGLNLTSLGYGGNCHMEPMVGRMIRDMHADYISLCLGINVMGGHSLAERTFRAAVIGLIQLIREKNIDTPIVVLSPIFHPPGEKTPNAVGMTLETMRDRIQNAVDVLHRLGDRRLYYVNGLEVFGPAQLQYMPDQLHPNAEGYRVFAERYSEFVMPHFNLASK
jgi:lysophospholipase L1-like esterase